MRAFQWAVALGLAAAAARADLPPIEMAEVAGAEVRIWTVMFLDGDEVQRLRGFLAGPEAFADWMPLSGHGALAVAPEEGLWRAGARVGSAVAVGGMASDETASLAALAACNALRRTETACIVLLQVAPK